MEIVYHIIPCHRSKYFSSYSVFIIIIKNHKYNEINMIFIYISKINTNKNLEHEFLTKIFYHFQSKTNSIDLRIYIRTCVICLLSWFPRSRCTRSGNRVLRPKNTENMKLKKTENIE